MEMEFFVKIQLLNR